MIFSRKIPNLFTFLLPAFILSLLFQNFSCWGLEYNPKGMDYELRRPITYLYNRLAYKYGITFIIQISTLMFRIFSIQARIVPRERVRFADLSTIGNLWIEKCPWVSPINKFMPCWLPLFPLIELLPSKSKKDNLMHFSFLEITAKSLMSLSKSLSTQIFTHQSPLIIASLKTHST